MVVDRIPDIRGFVVDQGGVRGPDGKYINLKMVGSTGVQEKKISASFNTQPVGCDETTIGPAADHLQKLVNNPEKVR